MFLAYGITVWITEGFHKGQGIFNLGRSFFICTRPQRRSFMYKKVSTDLNFVDREKATEKFWAENDIFEKRQCDVYVL